MASVIGTLGTISTLVVGGRVFVDNGSNFSNLINLVGSLGNTANHFTTLRLPSGSAGYQVTSGKTLTINAAKVTGPGGAGSNLTLLYGNTDVGYDSSSAPTTPIYPGGFSTTPRQIQTQTSSSYVSPAEWAPNFGIPSQKFAAFTSDSTGFPWIHCYGYEA